MKKHYKHLAVLGTICCLAALGVLWCSVLTSDWLTLQEPQVDENEIEKLRSFEEPKPHLIRAKFGLFKMCVHNSQRNTVECHELQWYNFGFVNLFPARQPPPMQTELIANCVEKLRFTLPFIGLSVFFTTASFLSLTFGHFCPKNKKIVEASMLILGGLCQATALLTFVSQIGSEFEANLPYSHHQKRLITFYKYKYGFSFYLFLLSFSLSELAALFDMAAYFRKYPPNHYVITFHRQSEPSPFMGRGDDGPHHLSPLPHHDQQFNSHLNPHHQNIHHHHQFHDSIQSGHHTLAGTRGTNNLIMSNHHNYNTYHPGTTLGKHPDLCNDFASQIVAGGGGRGEVGENGGHNGMDLTITSTAAAARLDENMPLPPQSYMSPEVTITTIERNSGYGTLRNPKVPAPSTMESFGTLRKENNI